VRRFHISLFSLAWKVDTCTSFLVVVRRLCVRLGAMEDVTNLFLQMESERDKVPHVLREDFVPSFIVSLLRRKLCDSNDTTTIDESNHMELGTLGAKFSVGDKWTDDSFLEDFADVESSLLLENERTVEYVNRVLAFGTEALSMFHVDYRRFIKTFIEEVV
jgi:hypothetical protein